MLAQKSVFFLPSAEGYVRLSEDPQDRGNDLPLRFSAFAQCDNKACDETASIAGIGYERTINETGHPELFQEFFPRYLNPSPELFIVPVRTPVNLRSQIESAFVLSWGDYEACLNRVRLCLEILLDLLKIPRSSTKNGRRTGLTLHRRVELAQVKVPAVEPFLMATKHLGNAGSHSIGLNRDDVFDALELLEAVVFGVYGNQQNIISLAKKVVAARGPIRRKAD